VRRVRRERWFHFAKMSNAYSVRPRESARKRGRTENAAPPVVTYSVVKEPVFSCQRARCGWRELRIGKRTSAPVSALGQGIALISFHHTTLLFEGDGAPTKRWPGSPGPKLARLAAGPGRETSRPAPCGAPTRHLRLTPQSAIGPHQELCVPGGLFPRPPVGQACVSARPQVAAPGPRLANASGRRPRLWTGIGRCLGEFHYKVNFARAPSPTSDLSRANGNTALLLFTDELFDLSCLPAIASTKSLRCTAKQAAGVNSMRKRSKGLMAVCRPIGYRLEKGEP
jgi:hypothetical protein